MTRRLGRWLGTAIAVLVVVALAAYVLTSGTDRAPAVGSPSPPEQAPALRVAPNAPAQGQPPGSAIIGAGELVGLLLKTGLVVALLGASLWALRRYAGTASGRRGTGAVTIAETLPLAQGRAVYVLDVGDRALLVGATPQQLTLLGEVRDAAVLARLRAPERRDPAPSLAGLVERLRAALAAYAPGRQAEGRGARRVRAVPSVETDFAATLARLDDTAPGLEPRERLAAFAARVRAPRGPR